MQTSAPMLPNLLRYQAAWFATVLGAAHDQAELGAGVGCLLVIWHLWRATSASTESRVVLMTLVVGALWEVGMVHFGMVRYPAGWAIVGVPLWILVLWAAFGTTLNGCLGWLRQRLGLSAVLGGILGPLSWYGGARLGALMVPEPSLGYLALAAGWSLLMPLLSWGARRFTEHALAIEERS